VNLGGSRSSPAPTERYISGYWQKGLPSWANVPFSWRFRSEADHYRSLGRLARKLAVPIAHILRLPISGLEYGRFRTSSVAMQIRSAMDGYTHTYVKKVSPGCLRVDENFQHRGISDASDERWCTIHGTP